MLGTGNGCEGGSGGGRGRQNGCLCLDVPLYLSLEICSHQLDKIEIPGRVVSRGESKSSGIAGNGCGCWRLCPWKGFRDGVYNKGLKGMGDPCGWKEETIDQLLLRRVD